jgi:hypothetical protein
MSKRKGDVTVAKYMVLPLFPTLTLTTVLTYLGSCPPFIQRRGWEPAAVLNWLALAGWGVQHDLVGDASVSEASFRPHPHQDAPDSTMLMSLDELISEVSFPPFPQAASASF